MARRPPGKSVEAREKQLIDLAINLAEKQLEDGTASPSVVTHFLKLATVREQLEREGLEQENTLKRARTDAIESATRVEALYSEAMDAIRGYRGTDGEGFYDS